MVNHNPTAKFKFAATVLAAAAALSCAAQASAADWSDTYLGYRHGTNFSEPYTGDGISKNIYSLTHVSGYKYGSNFFNVDMLQSDSKNNNAQEAYVVYRNTLDLGKVTGNNFAFGPVRGMGVTAGFDWNSKNNDGYNSKKRMLVLGPTFMMDVPGFLNISLLALQESNFPTGISSRYTYDTHAMLTAAWGIPVASTGFAFEGFMNYIASKGKNEFGGATAPETDIDMQLMYDVGSVVGVAKNTLRAGLEYQYWRNKFGNPSNVVGSLAKTPMVRVEYHF